MAPLHDVFHRAMARARDQAAGVELVHGAAAQLLKQTGPAWAPSCATDGAPPGRQ
jgi:hypothetical protein